MNSLNKFLLVVLILLLVLLGGIWFWQRILRSRTETSTAPSPPALPSAAATAPSPAATASTEFREQWQAALELRAEKKLAAARDALRKLLEEHPDSELTPEIERMLGEINIQILTTPVPAPEKVEYTVQPGDTLDRIARKFRTTIELIQRSHGLKNSVIRPGERFRVYQGDFRVVVNKESNTLTVYDHGRFFKKYRVGTGEYSTTPTGDFQIVERIPNPPWWKDGKMIPFGDTNNILGTYWLALNVPGYGIHGTWEPDSIGKQSSAGCVRMLNEDIAELFLILPPRTPVTITD